eukprot:TRINITY_DN11762_c0_g1_i1.p1 TRINITY_DN11762_c0_g1~~TRINITY_DN11762_c0_g1_i1.p1  ORF type:complete len:337 (-),score=57.67 TRINITY_DN11762_c0_g1_i1:815-1825(-)
MQPGLHNEAGEMIELVESSFSPSRDSPSINNEGSYDDQIEERELDSSEAFLSDGSNVFSTTTGLESSSSVSFPKTMSLLDAVCITVGIMIGTGIFASPGVILKETNSVGLSILVWIGAGLLCALGGCCYAELAAAMPLAGGDYVYFTRTFGKAVGFLYTWACFFVIETGSKAIIAIVFAKYIGSLIYSIDIDSTGSSLSASSSSVSGIWSDHDAVLKMVAVSAIMILTLINCWGVEWGNRVQNALVVVKLLLMLFLIGMAVFGFTSGATTQIAKTNFDRPFGSLSFSSFISALGVGTISALWAYDGYSDVVMVTEEIKNPATDLPNCLERCFMALG